MHIVIGSGPQEFSTKPQGPEVCFWYLPPDYWAVSWRSNVNQFTSPRNEQSGTVHSPQCQNPIPWPSVVRSSPTAPVLGAHDNSFLSAWKKGWAPLTARYQRFMNPCTMLNTYLNYTMLNTYLNSLVCMYFAQHLSCEFFTHACRVRLSFFLATLWGRACIRSWKESTLSSEK